MKGYKGFDKDMKCRGVRFKVGETVEHKGDIKLCSSGLHFCEHPLDTLNYYPLTTSKYAEVEAEEVSTQTEQDTKRVCKKLSVKAELDIRALVSASIKFILSKCEISNTTVSAKKEKECSAAQGYSGHSAAQGDYGHSAAQGNRGHSAAQGYQGHSAAQGDYGHSAAQGDYGHSAAQGNRGHSAAQGYYGHSAAQGNRGHSAAQGDHGHSAVMGKDSIAAAFGIEGQAKAVMGSWIMCAEWCMDAECNWHIKSVKTAKIDGKKLKPDVFYQLKGGKFVAAQ